MSIKYSLYCGLYLRLATHMIKFPTISRETITRIMISTNCGFAIIKFLTKVEAMRIPHIARQPIKLITNFMLRILDRRGYGFYHNIKANPKKIMTSNSTERMKIKCGQLIKVAIRVMHNGKRLFKIGRWYKEIRFRDEVEQKTDEVLFISLDDE